MIHIFTWTSSAANHTLYLAFRKAGLSSQDIIDQEIAITIQNPNFSEKDAVDILSDFVNNPPLPDGLCYSVFSDKIPPIGKHGGYLSLDLMAKAYSAKYIDIVEAQNTAKSILNVS